MPITFFLVEVGSSLIALFKALFGSIIATIDNYKNSQKPKSSIFVGKL